MIEHIKQKKSLIKWLLIVYFMSILFVGVFLAVTSGVLMSNRTNSDYREIAEATSVNVANVFDSLSDGKFSYDKDKNVFKKGDIVCIVEAMKLMNEIQSEVSGKIVEICVENGQPIEFGQVLMYVE